jgi:D-amino peptidase
MRVLLSVDMEGATGVVAPDDVRPGSNAWIQCRAFLTGDVNAAIAGFLDGGASEVLVNEAHSSMRNLVLQDLDHRARVIVGRDKPFGMMEGIDRRIDRVAFIGYHAAAGGEGVLSHTYLASGIVDVRINGQTASEGRMNAVLAAEFGVPVVLVTGDTETCADAAGYAPEAIGVPVKETIGRYTAVCRSPADTAGAIRTAATDAARRSFRPPGVEGPFTYEVEFAATSSALLATAIPGVERSGPRGIRFTLDRMAEAIRCFKAVTVLATAASELDYG